MTTLAHEMIHQWQYDILKRRPNHGQDFRRMMARMNLDGLGITIYHSLGKAVTALANMPGAANNAAPSTGGSVGPSTATAPLRAPVGTSRECGVVPDEPLAEPIPVGPVGRQFSLPFQSS